MVTLTKGGPSGYDNYGHFSFEDEIKKRVSARKQLEREIAEALAAKKAPKQRKVGVGLSAIDDDEWSWSVEYLTDEPINYAATQRNEIIADGVEYSRGEAVAKIKEALAKIGVAPKDAVALPF